LIRFGSVVLKIIAGRVGNEMIDLDEPLIDGPQGDRCFRAPTMGIAMRIGFVESESVGILEELDDGLVGFAAIVLFENWKAFEGLGELLRTWKVGCGHEASFVIDRAIDGEPHLEAELIILVTVTWSDMNEAGSW
jgi:hypothetical protein